MTIMTGIDLHKATHTAVAANENEVVLGEFKVPASKLRSDCCVIGRTGSRDVSGRSNRRTGSGIRLQRELVAAGETVLDVSPMLASRV